MADEKDLETQDTNQLSELEVLSHISYFEWIDFIKDVLGDMAQIDEELQKEDLDSETKYELEEVKKGLWQTIQKLRMAGIYS